MERLLIIHDEMTPEMLATAYWSGAGDFKAKADDFKDGSALEAFAQVNAERGRKLRKVAEKLTGLKATY